MTKELEIYRCALCGNIVEVFKEGAGTLVCCGQEMSLVQVGVLEADQEKHIPIIEQVDTGYRIQVGKMLHPMEENHYIEWIESIGEKGSSRFFLKPNELPQALFCKQTSLLRVRAYCNVHGLWEAQL
jgi:superoxide reductase